MQKRPVVIVSPVEKCENGCGRKVAVTVRQDDGAKRVSTIADDGSTVLPGPHLGTCMGRR